MNKERLSVAAVIVLAVAAFATKCHAEGPYLQGLWTKNAPVYLSQGSTFMPSTLKYDRTFTNLAVAYHPLSAGSLIPPALQTYLPPESWACTIGGGYASADGSMSAGFGCGLNLLDSVRAWGSDLLALSTSETALAIADQIKPGHGPLNLYASRQWDDTLARPWVFAPRWFFGASFGF